MMGAGRHHRIMTPSLAMETLGWRSPQSLMARLATLVF